MYFQCPGAGKKIGNNHLKLHIPEEAKGQIGAKYCLNWANGFYQQKNPNEKLEVCNTTVTRCHI